MLFSLFLNNDGELFPYYTLECIIKTSEYI